jgi:hypothetical protein
LSARRIAQNLRRSHPPLRKALARFGEAHGNNPQWEVKVFSFEISSLMAL